MNKYSAIGTSRMIFQVKKIILYGAAAWAFIFAVLHFVWAAGFYIFLPKDLASRAFGQKWFLIYDLAAGFLCFVGAVLIFFFTNQFGSRPHIRYGMKILLLIGTTFLVLRAVAGIGMFIYLLFRKQSLAEAISFWDWWFCLGAILCAVSFRQILQHDKL